MSRDIADIYPLTSMQQGMLIESLTAPADRPVYLQHYDLQVTGVPAPNVLLAGFADIAARYDVLRTSFIWDVGDTPLQVVRREVVVPVDVTDLRGSAGEVDSAVADALDAEGARAFDLDRAPLLRARAFRLSADSWRLVTTHHHLVLDGWSVPIVHAALVDAWRAHVAGRPLPASPAGRFREFVGWQRSTVDDAHDERYFTDLLGDVSTATPLGPELPPGLDEGGRSTPGRVTRTLDVDPARHPDARAPVAGVLPSTLVHAAWALTLARWADVDDVVFGSTVSGRATELADAAGRVGMFVNTAPVRITVPDADVGRYLAAVARRLDQARRHDQSSVAVAARCSSVGSGQALLSSVLAFQNYWRPDHEAIGSTDSGPALRVRQRVEHTDLPVAAAVALPGSGVWVRLDYDRSRVGDDTARRLADTCAELVVELATAPAQTPLGALAAGPSGTVGDQPAATRATVDVVAALRAQALARPDHDALTGPGGPMSFRALSSVVSRAGGTDDSGPIIVRAPYDVEAAAALVAAAATGRAVTLVDTYASAAEQTERRFPGPAEQAARIVNGCALVIESVGLTPSDRVAIADGSALSGAGVIVAAVCAGASVQLEAAAPTDATVVVGGPLAVSDLVGSASPQCRVVITGEPPPCAVLAALLDAGHRCYRVVAHHDSGTIVGCGALRRAERARDLARIDGGICLDRAGRAATPDASGELAVRAPDGVLRLGIRCRTGAGGTVEQLGLGPDDDTVWAESIIGCDDAVKAAAFGADRVLWLVASRAGPDLTALDRRLRARLPERLRPTGYQVLGRLPVTTDGRADRGALIATTGPGVRAAAGGSPPDPLADRLAELPDSTRGRVVDALRAAAARTPGLRHSVRDRVAVSAQQQQWASAEPVLRDHGRYPLREPERAELEAAIRVGTIAPDAAPIGTTAEGASYATVPPGALDLPAVAGLVAGVRPTGQLTAADYASWQTDGARASHRARQLAGWRDAFAGLDRSGLQLDGQPDAATGVNEVTVAVPGGCADVDTWVAATAVALAHLAGSDDVTVGVVTRPALPIELDGVPGPFARMLPVRVTVGADDDFATVRATAGTALAQARARGEVPWPDLAALLPEVPPVSLAVHHRAGALAAHAGTPLALDVAPIHQGVLVTALADTSLAHPELARRVAGLAAAVVLVGSRDAHGPISPADLIVDDAGCGRVGELLRRGDGGPGEPPPATSIPDWVRLRAVERPGAVAVRAAGTELTYADLMAAADGLAAALRNLGVRPDDRVAVCLPREAAMVWAPLGVQVAGAAYMPVDPTYPDERIAAVCTDADVRAVVTTAELADRFAGRVVVDVADIQPLVDLDAGASDGASPDAAAYVIYTSGSTGVPKGVVVSQRAIVDFCHHIAAAYQLTPATRLLGFAALSFDVSAFDLWAALTSGATLVLATDEERASVEALQQLMRSERVTAAELPPSLMPLLRPVELPDLRLVSVGGEAPAGALVDGWRTGGREFWNGYGPTETAVAVTLMRCEPPSLGRVPPIGLPMSGHRAYVVDAALRLLPDGVPGELVIAGPGLARGYLGQPGMTAERFVPDPYGTEPGARMYRTGDLARWTAARVLEFLGRADRQVKVRGFRVELGDVEAAVADHPAVRQVTVETWDDPAGTRHLVAYVVATADPPTLEHLRAVVGDRLPAYMVPTRLVVLERMPLTRTNKIDRAALPEPTATPESPPADGGSWTETERVLAEEVIAPLLGVPSVGRDDGFFVLGGNSLQATQVTARVRDRFGVEIRLLDFFTDPTVAKLAGLVAAAGGRAGAAPGLGRLSDPGRYAMTDGAVLPLSYPQQALFAAWRAGGDAVGYHAPFALRLHGQPLDLPAIRRTFDWFVARHAPLRVTFDGAGSPADQHVHPAGSVPIRIVDVPGATTEERLRAVRRLIGAENAEPFDLETGPLLRITVYRCDESDNVLEWNIHHVATDGWSTGIALQQIGTAYDAFRAGAQPPFDPLPADYGAFVDWHHDYVGGPQYQRDLAWWRANLAGAPRSLELTDVAPADRPAFRPGWHNLRLPGDCGRDVQDLARTHNATMYMVLLAAYCVVLAADSGRDDIVVITPNALRPRSDWESLVGWFVNRVPVRVRLDRGSSFAELVQACRTASLESFAHGNVPLELLRAELGDGGPAMQALFSVQNAPPAGGVGLQGLDVEPIGDDSGRDFTPLLEVYSPLEARLQMSIVVRERGDGTVAGGLEYDAALFDDGRAERWHDGYLAVLGRGAAAPDTPVADLLALTRPARPR